MVDAGGVAAIVATVGVFAISDDDAGVEEGCSYCVED